jgi:two-component system, chemotaxis family, chemotaxis protein CheY
MSGQRSILIVEDSSAMRQLLSLAVRKHGAQVTEAPDGLAALKLMATERYDLVFVDLNMPILDGMKLIQRVRSDHAMAATRICVVTTESARATEEQARMLGADFFLRKPVARRDVDRILAEAFPAQG